MARGKHKNSKKRANTAASSNSQAPSLSPKAKKEQLTLNEHLTAEDPETGEFYVYEIRTTSVDLNTGKITETIRIPPIVRTKNWISTQTQARPEPESEAEAESESESGNNAGEMHFAMPSPNQESAPNGAAAPDMAEETESVADSTFAGSAYDIIDDDDVDGYSDGDKTESVGSSELEVVRPGDDVRSLPETEGSWSAYTGSDDGIVFGEEEEAIPPAHEEFDVPVPSMDPLAVEQRRKDMEALRAECKRVLEDKEEEEAEDVVPTPKVGQSVVVQETCKPITPADLRALDEAHEKKFGKKLFTGSQRADGMCYGAMRVRSGVFVGMTADTSTDSASSSATLGLKNEEKVVDSASSDQIHPADPYDFKIMFYNKLVKTWTIVRAFYQQYLMFDIREMRGPSVVLFFFGCFFFAGFGLLMALNTSSDRADRLAKVAAARALVNGANVPVVDVAGMNGTGAADIASLTTTVMSMSTSVVTSTKTIIVTHAPASNDGASGEVVAETTVNGNLFKVTVDRVENQAPAREPAPACGCKSKCKKSAANCGCKNKNKDKETKANASAATASASPSANDKGNYNNNNIAITSTPPSSACEAGTIKPSTFTLPASALEPLMKPAYKPTYSTYRSLSSSTGSESEPQYKPLRLLANLTNSGLLFSVPASQQWGKIVVVVKAKSADPKDETIERRFFVQFPTPSPPRWFDTKKRELECRSQRLVGANEKVLSKMRRDAAVHASILSSRARHGLYHLKRSYRDAELGEAIRKDILPPLLAANAKLEKRIVEGGKLAVDATKSAVRVFRTWDRAASVNGKAWWLRISQGEEAKRAYVRRAALGGVLGVKAREAAMEEERRAE